MIRWFKIGPSFSSSPNFSIFSRLAVYVGGFQILPQNANPIPLALILTDLKPRENGKKEKDTSQKLR